MLAISLLFLAILAQAPGAVATRSGPEVCAADYAAAHRHVSPALRRKVYRLAGITNPRGYVVDHVVPLALGGANALANLQAQPAEEARDKDRLEVLLRVRVCQWHRMTLPDAQECIAADWRACARAVGVP